MSERQDELNALDTRMRAIKAAPEAVQLEVRRMEAEARSRVGQLQDALERNPKEARAILSAIFDGKLTATPLTDQRGTRFVIEGTASVGRMLAFERESPEGVSKNPPQKFASLRG